MKKQMKNYQGLYDRSKDKDGCGVGLIAKINGQRSHGVVQDALAILKNLEHRGAAGSDPLVGDGAGILTQIPHELFADEFQAGGAELPEEGEYGVGMIFLPADATVRDKIIRIVEEVVESKRLRVFRWREVPKDNACLSPNMLHMEPVIMQFFIACDDSDQESFERQLYVIRRNVENTVGKAFPEAAETFALVSLSASTVVYKGMFLAYQLESYYEDLSNPLFRSCLALYHQRYSTNTFPTWSLAQPFRYLAHNGEINTIQGNVNWCKSRECQLHSDLFGDSLREVFPIIPPGASDSSAFDNFFELLVQAGRSLDHCMMLMMPEAWENNPNLSPELKAFYEYGSMLMEPWDGPAAIAFTNGRQIGARLDRNGLRPARYLQTRDGLFILSSEAGALEIPPEKVKARGMLGSGQMVLVDTVQETLEFDEAVKRRLSLLKPYRRWLDENRILIGSLPHPPVAHLPDHETVRLRQRIFSYTYEQLYLLIKPMAEKGEETTYAMGTDTPLSVLSRQPKLLYTYFKQRFAQVTNPPIDSIREELVMSLRSNVGGGYNLLEDYSISCKMLEIPQPVLTNAELEQLRDVKIASFRSASVDIVYPYEKTGLRDAIEELRAKVEKKVDEGYRIIVLSDRKVGRELAPIPALLATSAVHHDLIRKNKRGKIGLVVESGEVREVHHVACLIGFGAGAVNPYLAFETISDLAVNGQLGVSSDERAAEKNYISALQKGLKKIFAKMGISTLISYQAAQIFEAVGVNDEVIDEYFTGTSSQIQGASLSDLEEEIKRRHARAYAAEAAQNHKLLTGGEYNWRQQGEFHSYNPEVVHLLQQAAWRNDGEIYRSYAAKVNDQSRQLCTLRGLFSFNADLPPVPLEEVESAGEIVKRFCSGAMSIGSISREAHETLAVAMNRLGGRSNTGEGGEDEIRFKPDANGDLRRSAIKQVASGRFGVTSYYLVNADEHQIKIAQGAKPGEGGQLPGFKVDEYIAKLRHTIPGVSLISPPPHHDIYSIEDLSQLIFDLKNANRRASISVKLVASHGVGVVAAGVAKAKADQITIAGYDGGTGASPATSIKHAGIPWEIGLSETQQTLVANNLRGQVRLQVDGQVKTGRDVVMGALLGAEEFGFSTSVLIATGCIMMRKCHLNTCPVGIATQDPYLRSKYHGKPEHVMNFLTFVAEEVREIMAELGYRKFDEMVGRSRRIEQNHGVEYWKSQGLDLKRIFHQVESPNGEYRNVRPQSHQIQNNLDHVLIEKSRMCLEYGKPVSIRSAVHNKDRTVGTMLGSEISRIYGQDGLPEDSIKVSLEGSAGQSFGAFVPSGLTLDLTGEANDYVGKGLSGGKIIVKPHSVEGYEPEKNAVVGNTCLYGATSGKAFISGKAGQRFAVRNSGAVAVVEGVGEHACEYMTGGTVVVLGKAGRNFGAGMSGGLAFVYDRRQDFKTRCNPSMVEVEAIHGPEHVRLLESLLAQHAELTGSPVARGILADFKRKLKTFAVVIPFEYRKVMTAGGKKAANV